MNEVAENLFEATSDQRFLGLEVGCRMTIVRLGEELLIHSPIDVSPESLKDLGRPRWVLAPNLLHHLYLGPWLAAGCESWCPPGLPEKRTDLSIDHVVEEPCEPFGEDVLLVPLKCFSFTNEIVLLHRPTRTLVVTDLMFNFSRQAPWTTRTAMRMLMGYPGCRTTLLERVGMKRAIARQEISDLLALDFDRVIVSHGDIVPDGGKRALQSAFSWLL